jgi:hypothetical protein
MMPIQEYIILAARNRLAVQSVQGLSVLDMARAGAKSLFLLGAYSRLYCDVTLIVTSVYEATEILP